MAAARPVPYTFWPLRGPFLVSGRCAANSVFFCPLRGLFLVFGRFAAHSLFGRPTPPPGGEGQDVRFRLQQGMDTLWTPPGSEFGVVRAFPDSSIYSAVNNEDPPTQLSPTVRFYILIWSNVWSRFQSADLHRKIRPNFENTPSRVKNLMVGDTVRSSTGMNVVPNEYGYSLILFNTVWLKN